MNEEEEIDEGFLKNIIFNYVEKVRNSVNDAHLVFMFDCYHRKEVFKLRVEEEAGFDFLKYRNGVWGMKEKDLKERIDESLMLLF